MCLYKPDWSRYSLTSNPHSKNLERRCINPGRHNDVLQGCCDVDIKRRSDVTIVAMETSDNVAKATSSNVSITTKWKLQGDVG